MRLDGGVLLRLGGRKLGLPDSERDLPARNPGARHRCFYAIGTGLGGVAGPALFGALVETGSRTSIFGGYLFGSALMIAAAVVAAVWGVAAERQPLEAVARPLAFADSDARFFWTSLLRVALPPFAWIMPQGEHAGGAGRSWRDHTSAA